MSFPDALSLRRGRASAVDARRRVVGALAGLVSSIPDSSEPPSAHPLERSKAIAHARALKAATVSGSLSLPVGPAGWLTILPDLMAVLRIQQQMVADIGAAFGGPVRVRPEEMLYCLFRHTAAQALRDIVVRAGERVVVARASERALQTTVRKVGVRLTDRLIGRGVSRWVPVLGALGVAGYVFYDTMRVADTSIALFSAEQPADAPPGSPMAEPPR